jgi:hypothetical protein
MIESEEWRVCETGYEVSNLGRVRSIPGYYRAGTILAPITNPRGYLNVKLYVNQEQLTRNIHRLVASAFIENLLNLPDVHHKDNVKSNNVVTNLEWKTKLDNYEQALEDGLILRGSAHQNSKLTEEMVIAIKGLLALGVYPKTLGEEFDVSSGTISQIRLEETWAHIPWPAGYVPDSTSLHRKGSLNTNSILTEELVREIRKKYSKGYKQVDLAREYGVTRGTMSQLILGKTWKHVI